MNLDSYIEHNIIIPDFIKIDAEGFESKILSGMNNILQTSRPLITLEMAGEDNWSKNRSESIFILSNNDYESYEMFDNGYIKKCDIKSFYTYTNILFVPNEKINLVKDLIKC